MKRFAYLLGALTPKQAASVAFVATFVTVIGGIALAFYFRRRNKKLSDVKSLLGS